MRKLRFVLSILLVLSLLLSAMPAALAEGTGTTTEYTVSIDAGGGAPFNISAPPPLGNDEPSSYTGEATISVEAGTTLADMGIKVWHDEQHLPYFEGWRVYIWDSKVDWWTEKKDSDGNFILLDTAAMLATPIDEDVRFEPSWQTYTVLFEDVDGGTFDQVDPYSGDIYRDDCSKAGSYVSYYHNLEDGAVINDLKNGSKTFYGWDVYELIEDPNNSENNEMIPLAGPISTQDVVSRRITHDVVYRANWTGDPLIAASAGFAISGNGGTFDIVRTNETWEDVEHTREDFDIYVGDVLTDLDIVNITDLKFWDGEREFLGWEAMGMRTIENENGTYQEWGPLYDRLLTTQEILTIPAAETYIELIAIWAGDDADYFTTVHFNAMGGIFPVTAYDYTEDGPVVLGTIPTDGVVNDSCMQNGQSVKEQLTSDCYPVGDPTREGYTFEGWLAVSEDEYWHEMSDKLYTTEQIVNLPIPEENIQYIAKWKEISMEEYRFGVPYAPYDGSYGELYFLANGSTFNCSVSHIVAGQPDTETYTDNMPYFFATNDTTFAEDWPDYTFELADKTNFEGWTTYSADRVYCIEILKEDTLNIADSDLTVMKVGENKYEDEIEGSTPIHTVTYLLLKNPKVYSTTMTPEDTLKLTGNTFYVSVAQWHTESSTLANVKAATCAAEGYTGDKVCANCGEILEKGKATNKVAHTEVTVTGKAATCTETGLTDGKKCSVCGTVTVPQTVIAVTSHTLTKVAAVAPTYTAAGNIEYYACACGALFADAEGKTAVTAEAVKLAQLIEIKESTAEISADAMDTAIAEAEKEAETSGSVNIVIDVAEAAKEEAAKPESGSTTETKPAPVVSSAALPVASLEKVAKVNEEATLTVNMTEVTVIMDAKTMAAVAEQSAGETVTLKVEKVETKALTEKQQAMIEDKEVAIVVSATLISNNTAISDFKGGNVTISVPFTLPEGTKGSDFQVYYVADDGTITAHDTEYKDGCLVFSTTHFSDYVVVNTARSVDPTVPNTGDQSHLLFFTTMLLISAAGFYLATRKMRRA